MYKDADKQREAVRRAVAKKRAKGITSEGITEQGITSVVQQSNTMIKDEQGILYYPLKGGLTGQRFYPGRLGYHPDNCKCGIQHASKPL